ncbi:MAG: DUF1553 domain-containing protein [Planctomycetales bacterium]|nr:DUF1553 domain-containing protein [Planctomycetales bacterium]
MQKSVVIHVKFGAGLLTPPLARPKASLIRSGEHAFGRPAVAHVSRSGDRDTTSSILNRRSSILALLAVLILSASASLAGEFRVVPDKVALKGNFSQSQLLATAVDGQGQTTDRSEDFTTKATYQSSDPNVATVSVGGRVLAVGNGQATITITADGIAKQISVEVTDVLPQAKIGFFDHVAPILSKTGCNMGACHASQHGKGGLIFSVFGFDPDGDHRAIVRDRQGRRVNFLDPAQSLLLLKPTMTVGHGGGRRMEAGSIDHQILVAWLAAGAPGPQANSPKLKSLAVTPTHRLAEPGAKQQLRVIATYADGQTRDVTSWAKFDSMDESVFTVTSQGLVSVIGKGQASVMVRFEGQADICMVVSPYAPSVDLAGWQDRNYIDTHAAAKFRELGIPPSQVCDDATFIRRAFLDVTGSLPTGDEATSFIDSPDPDKRKKLIDRLLGLTGDPALDIYNDRYASFWTLRWADLIRNDSQELNPQGMWALHNWMLGSFRENKPVAQLVRELVTAQGSVFSNGPANYYRIAKNAPDLAESTAQVFLGVRLMCAKCHHHPFEKYSQADYYGFAAFFSRVSTKNSQEFGLFGAEQVVMVRSSGEINHPRTGQRMPPTPLDGESVDDPLDRRIPLANWLTSKENKYFAENIVNRYMRFLLGRGLVEPVDDMRGTNPPTNIELMGALAKSFRDSNFNLKILLRDILNSRLYQLDSQPTPQNAADGKFYSHFTVKRLPAESLLDAVDIVTGSQTKFPNLPLGTRAIELPDAQYPNVFLNTFGKPKRASVCECERSPDPNLAQALHVTNGDIVQTKLADANGRIAKLLAAKKSHEEIMTELYLTAWSRRPTDAEIQATRSFLPQAASPQEAYQDLLWALINSKQFLFVH